MPTFKWTFRADDAGASKAMKEFAASVKAAETATDQAAGKMSADLDRVAASAKKTSTSAATVAGVRQSAAGGLDSLVGRSPVASNVLGQFGGSEALLAGISTKLVLATAGVAALGVGVAKFGADTVEAFTSAAEAVDKFQDVSGATARESSIFVGAAQQLGVSTDALSGSMFKMLKNVNGNEDKLREYGATVVHTAAGNVDAVATFESIAQAFATTVSPAQRAELATLAFGKGAQQIIDVLERGGPELDKFFRSAEKHAPMLSDKDLGDAVKYKQDLTELSQEFDRFKSNVGKKTVPILSNMFANMADFTGWITRQSDATDNMTDKERAAANSMFAHYMPAMGAASDATRQLTNTVIDAGQALYASAAAASSAASAWQAATADVRSVHDVTENYNASLSTLDDLNAKVFASSTDASGAVDDGGRQIASANDGVAKAIEAVAEAEADYQKTMVDSQEQVARTVADAQQRIQDVEESSAKKIVDAQKRIEDARRKAADQATSSARRLVDAEQAVRDAAVAALRDNDPYAASRKREDAEQSLARVKEDSAKDQQDSARDIADAQNGLRDTESEAARDRARAEQDAAQQIADAHKRAAEQIEAAQKRVQDANDQVTEANQRVGQATDDAAASAARHAATATRSVPSHQELGKALQGVADNAFNQAYQMKLAGASDEEIAAFLAGTTDTINRYGKAWGFTADELKYYNNQVAQIRREVNVQFNMSLNASQFYAALDQAGAKVGTSGAQLLADAAGLGITPVLQRDSGGPLPPGLSLVNNQTGRDEWVSTPSQMAAMGGTTVVVQGSLITERELASILADMKRKGF